MTEALTASDLLTRRLHLHWHEGIAVVRSVAESLLERPGTVRIPELHQINLDPNGSVTLTGGVPVTDPVRRLGQLLQAMLTDAEAPVQLRLIISQATAPTPSYSSVGELDHALAHLERPDRTGLLKALIIRAEGADPMTADDELLTLDRVAPLPEQTPADLVAPPHRMNLRRRLLLAGAIIMILTVSGAATLYLKNVRMAPKGRAVSQATVGAADAMGAAVMAAVSAVSDRVGLGRLVAEPTANTANVPVPASPLAPKPKTQVTGPATGTLHPVVPDLQSLREGATVANVATLEGARLAAASIQRADTPEQPADIALDSAVYAAGSDGVSPPIGLRTQLPRQLPPTADPAKLSRIEVIIARDGSVESARLLGNERDVRGGMLLSAAKTWRFGPATKNGVAVRYRKTFLVSFE